MTAKKYCQELDRKKKRCDMACMTFNSEGQIAFDFNYCGSDLKIMIKEAPKND